MRKQWKKSNLHMPCALIERGDPVKYRYAESVKDYILERHNGTCIGANRQAKKCDCLCKVDGTFLSCLEEYVDTTWRHQTLHGKLEIAKNTVCVDGTGIKGKFLMPFDVGAIFHPLCPSSWSRLLGCSTKHLKVFCQVLSGRRTVSSVAANASPPGPPIISDGEGVVMYYQRMKVGADHDLKRRKPKAVKEAAGSHLHQADMEKVEMEMIVEGAKKLVYYIGSLKHSPHGSELRRHLPAVREHHQKMGIRIVEVTPSQAVDGEVRVEEMKFQIAYPSSKIVSAIERDTPDLPEKLVRYMVNAHPSVITIDKRRCDHADFEAVEEGKYKMQRRIVFGWTQIQQRRNKCSLRCAGVRTPSCSSKQFTAMPKDLQIMMLKVMSLSEEYVLSANPEAFSNTRRYNLFGKWLRGFLECKPTDPRFSWEYVDVLITANSKLCRHMDHVNDGTKGYNFCCVHSFSHVLNGVDYKVSIIMTTRERSRLAGPLENIMQKSDENEEHVLIGGWNNPIKFKHSTECTAPRPLI